MWIWRLGATIQPITMPIKKWRFREVEQLAKGMQVQCKSWDANASRSTAVSECQRFHWKTVWGREEWRCMKKGFWRIKEKKLPNKGVLFILLDFQSCAICPRKQKRWTVLSYTPFLNLSFNQKDYIVFDENGGKGQQLSIRWSPQSLVPFLEKPGVNYELRRATPAGLCGAWVGTWLFS